MKQLKTEKVIDEEEKKVDGKISGFLNQTFDKKTEEAYGDAIKCDLETYISQDIKSDVSTNMNKSQNILVDDKTLERSGSKQDPLIVKG